MLEALWPLQSAQAARKSVLGGQREDGYDLVTYVKYEYAPPADQAKKAFEASLMEEVLDRRHAQGGRSLDIGCATGRWPIWFSRRGYSALGIDISPAAIQLCNARAALSGIKGVCFENKNILEDEVGRDAFSVVTCMMGTFNHIPWSDADRTLTRVARALRPSGLFVFSTWNAQSPFVDFLSFDGQRAKANLRANCPPLEAICEALRRHRFVNVEVTPFCLLPNNCYDTWENEFTDIDALNAIDRCLRSHISDKNAQMFFVSAERSPEDNHE